MFETAVDDPGRNAIRRLAGLFRVSAIGLVLGGIAFVFGQGRSNPIFAGIFMAFSVLCAAGAWVTASGVESQKGWARYAGLAIAILSLFSFGIGTIFGLIELYSLWRAERTGQFRRGVDAA
jgi:Trk-type K+ transport system membrane component